MYGIRGPLLLEQNLFHLTEDRTEAIHDRADHRGVVHVDPGALQSVHRVDTTPELESLEVVLDRGLVTGAESTGDRLTSGKKEIGRRIS